MQMNKEEIKEAKKKHTEKIIWMKVIFLPLVVGFSLVYAKINMPLFRLIGWFLLIFGILSGSLYLFMLYKTHEENIKKGKERILEMFRSKKK